MQAPARSSMTLTNRNSVIRASTPAPRPPLRFLSPTRSGPCRPSGAHHRASALGAQVPLTPPSPQFFLCYRRARLVRYRARGAGGTLRPAKRPCAAPLPHFRGRRQSQRAKRGELLGGRRAIARPSRQFQSAACADWRRTSPQRQPTQTAEQLRPSLPRRPKDSEDPRRRERAEFIAER